MRTPFVVLLVLLALLAGCTSNSHTQASSPASDTAQKQMNEARLAEARLLKNQHRNLEAAAIYEELLKQKQENGDVAARLATVLSAQARLESDPAKIKSLNLRAREQAERAEKLGTTDPMPPLILKSIRPDGSSGEISQGAFSKREQVDKLMRDGELAFGRNDFGKAGECYQKAYELEPTNYTAALYSGDACFSGRELENACNWFRKAIAISPDVETAHRYLADALARNGQREEAFKEYVTAVVCEPYARTTRQHFTADMRALAEKRGYKIPRFPEMRSTIEGKQINLAVGPDGGMLIMGYNLCAVAWRSGEFAKHFPNEKTPRRSLPEEISAIGSMLELAAASKDDEKADLKKWQPVVDGLAALKRDGLLEAYVLLERADKELVKDYAAYRAENRDKLERYVRLYWCGQK